MLTSLNHLPFGSDVYVVSDTQYQEFRRKEAQKEIKLLVSRAAAYRKTADLIEEEINQIKKDVGLLAPSDTSDKQEE
jgi:hypothetical protein